MAKYIDSEKLKRLVGELKKQAERNRCDTWGIVPDALEEVDGFITSLQQEQPKLPPIEYSETYYQKGLHDGFIKGQMEILKRVEEIGKRKAEPILVIKEQGQPEDIVVIAKTFLDALSKTPYNNKPITDAQIIVKQLLLFFENPKEYNPDAILEQPEVDFEKAYKSYMESRKDDLSGNAVTVNMKDLARHFAEWGAVHLNARKEE